MITFKVLSQFHKILHLIAKEASSWSPEGLLLLPKHSLTGFQTGKVSTFLEMSLCSNPACSVSEGKLSDGLPNPTRGSLVPNFLRTPGKREGSLWKEEQHKEDQGQWLLSFRCLPSCYQKDTNQSPLQNAGRV